MKNAAAKPSAGEVNTIRQRFLALNQERLSRAQEDLRERQQAFLDLLPLLFHLNDSRFPGFAGEHVPVGISDYRPSKRAVEAAAKVSPGFSYRRRALRTYDIYALYLIGSSGTVAYSKKSDFDCWICYRPGLSDDQLAALREKGDLIEAWAHELGLEVHFFLVDPEQFKAGQRDSLSSESSGTAQHYLLLEEFYRTGLLLAGRYPAWWLVPPEQEKAGEYESYLQGLEQGSLVQAYEYLDLGSPAQLPAEEFFGAALWQLFKGIDSPYKSVLKLLLMEVYASEYPATDLLSLRFKQAIYEGERSLDQLDPYIMLYKKLEEHLGHKDQRERLELVRRCFYFKVNERLSIADKFAQSGWRRKLMRELTVSWGWSQAYLEVLDARPTWKINRVLKERKALVSELTHSYQMLSRFAREHAGLALINQQDMTVLGRKLYAAFERKAGKIELVNRGISDDLWEPRVSLHQSRGRDGQEVWLLYHGLVGADEAANNVALKRGRSAIEVLVWSYFNGLVDTNNTVALYTRGSDLDIKEVRHIIGCLQKQLPTAEVHSTRMEDLARPARVWRLLLFINVGVDAVPFYGRVDQQLTSSRTDALSYSGLHENLALTFDQVLVTTWKEVLTQRYSGVDGLLTCLSDYMHSSLAQEEPPVLPSIYCFSSTRGGTIAQRILELFGDAVDCFHQGSDTARYILEVEHTYYALYMDNQVIRYRQLGNYRELVRYLANSQPSFSPVVVDRYALSGTLLPPIFRLNQPGVIQVVFQVDGNTAEVYVVDERGSLFRQRVGYYDRRALINHFGAFFSAVVRRQYHEAAGGEQDAPLPEVEFYQVVKQRNGQTRLVRRGVEDTAAVNTYFSVQVIGDVTDDDSPVFTIYCNEEEFTSLEYGNGLFQEVARYVVKQRQSNTRYPIYITDVDLPRTLVGDEPGGRAQTIHYLSYKKHIEGRLNEALKALA